METTEATLPLELVVALWKLGQSELNREQGKKASQSEELVIMRVAHLAKEWVREQQLMANNTVQQNAGKKSDDSHVRMNAVRPGEYRKVFGK